MKKTKEIKEDGETIFDEDMIRSYGIYFSLEQMKELEKLYVKLEVQLKTLYLSSGDFLKYGMEACERYKSYKNDKNLVKTISEKNFEYVKGSLFTIVLESYRQMKK